MKGAQGQLNSATSPAQGADNTGLAACACNGGVPIAEDISFDNPSAAPGKALPLLYEVLAMAEALHASGQTDSLDLRRLPLSTPELDTIRLTLGNGEVDASVQALGPSRVRETAMPGVWWITHYNQAEEIIAECIEVTLLPEILSSDRGALPSEIEGLRSRIAGLASQAR